MDEKEVDVFPPSVLYQISQEWKKTKNVNVTPSTIKVIFPDGILGDKKEENKKRSMVGSLKQPELSREELLKQGRELDLANKERMKLFMQQEKLKRKMKAKQKQKRMYEKSLGKTYASTRSNKRKRVGGKFAKEDDEEWDGE